MLFGIVLFHICFEGILGEKKNRENIYKMLTDIDSQEGEFEEKIR